MNKIFKVIWSKSRNCYVVASELAKGHTKAASTGDKTKRLALAAITALMLLPVGGFSYAADTATVEPAATGSTTAVEVYTKDGANNTFATINNVSTVSTEVTTLSSELNTLSTEVNMLTTTVNNKADSSSTVSSVTGSDATLTITKGNGTSSTVTVNNVAHATSADSATTAETATKATQDGAGNVIADTYATKMALANEATARETTDTALDTRITNVKEYLQNETEKNYVSKAGLASELEVKDAGVVKVDQTIGENVTALGKALDAETNARIWADKTQDKQIQDINTSLVATIKNVETVNQNVAAGFTALSKTDAAEAATREAKDNELNERITNEANAIHDEIKAGDTALNDRITNVKEYLEKQTSDNYVSKADAAVQDGAIVKAANTIGENVANLDAALDAEKNARIWADKTQDKVIQQVNQNMVDGFNTINKNMADGFNALSQVDAKEAQERAAADAAETAGRVAADAKLVEAVNSGLSLSKDNVLQKNTTAIDAQGNVTTSKTDANEMILNKGNDNQITLNDKGIKVGTNSSVVDKDGVYTGGDTYDASKAALKSDGSIKGANGAFTVDTNGNVTSKATITGETVTDGKGASMSNGTVTGKTLTDGIATITNGNIKTNGGYIQTGGGNVNTQGGEVRTNGGKVATSGGEINTGSGDIKTVGGNILTAGGKLNTSGGDIVAGTGNISGQNITASGVLSGDSLTVAKGMTGQSLTLTGGDLDAGAGTIKTTGEVDAGTLNVSGKATVKDLEVQGEFNAKTLSSKLDENNYTEIHGGNVTSVNSKVDTTDGKTYTSTSTLTEKGKTETASNGINRNVNKMDATESSNVITNDANGKTSTFEQRVDEILNQINSSDTVFSKVDQKVDNITSEVTDGTNTTSSTQTTTDITNTAEQGTIANNAKNLSNSASESITNTAGNSITNTATNGDITNNALNGTLANNAKNITNTTTENMTNVVGGNLTNTVTGDMTSSAKNISNTATEALTNTAKDITNNASNNITNIAAETLTNQGKNVATIASETASTNAKNITNTASENITNTASNGTITNEAKDLVNHATEDMTNTVDRNLTTTVGNDMTTTVTGKTMENYNGGLETTITGEEKHTVNSDQTNTINGKQTTTVTGDVTEDYKANLTTTVGGNQTTTVTGDSSLTAENINNTASNKITNKALDVETDATSSIVNKVANDYGSNTSTQLSYQTKEEMSQADGKTASYLRGAAEEKSQLTDGAKKTTIDTIAGQTNTNITEGTNISNSLQKADQIASSVTDGTNTTVVNQKAKSLASSITDGTKANNTNNTVDKSEQQIKASDTQYSATTKTASKTEDALVNGSTIIDSVKDSTTGTVSSAVTDGSTITGISQNAKDISLSATGGTIANEAKNITNKASETLSNSAKNITNTATEKLSNSAADIENKASSSILNQVGDNTSWKMTNGKVVEAIKGADGQTNTTTTTADDTYQSVQNGNNVLAKRTSSTNDNLNITDGTNTYSKITTATSNKQTVTDGTETASTNLTKSASNTYITNGTQTVTNHIAADTTNTVMNEGSNGSRQEQTASQILNRVTDGTNTSEVTQNASEVSASAKNITNTASEKITNQIGDGSAVKSEMTADGITNTATKITNITGNTTVTSDTTGTTFENTAHNTALTEMTKHESGDFKKTTISGNTLTTGQATMDYAEVMKDLGVHGNATVDGDTTLGKEGADTKLTVNSKSTFKDTVKMENTLEVDGASTFKDKVTVTNGGLDVNGGTTTDTLKVTGESTFGGKATFKDVVTMEKDLSVRGSMTASSYKVGDKTYIDASGINANDQKVVNVAPGRIAADSTDAINGSQLYQTNERVTGVENKVNNLDSRVDKVGANAAALANLHPLEFDADSKWNIAAAVGGYKGETATAIGAFYRPNENVMVNVSSSFGTGENMYGGGISLRIGQGGNKARRNATNGLTDREKAMQKQIDSLTNRLDALLSVINPNMSKDFPDVPENHWAYEAVSKLAGNGVIQGYEDGKYHGDRTMTRYEMAEIIYNALSKGAKAEKKLVEEFKPELQAMAAQKKA